MCSCAEVGFTRLHVVLIFTSAGEEAVKPVTTVPHCVSTFVSIKTTDFRKMPQSSSPPDDINSGEMSLQQMWGTSHFDKKYIQ